MLPEMINKPSSPGCVDKKFENSSYIAKVLYPAHQYMNKCASEDSFNSRKQFSAQDEMLEDGDGRAESRYRGYERRSERRAKIHETIMSESQMKDQLISEYHSKIERCK